MLSRSGTQLPNISSDEDFDIVVRKLAAYVAAHRKSNAAETVKNVQQEG